jgi:hypothetical protein
VWSKAPTDRELSGRSAIARSRLGNQIENRAIAWPGRLFLLVVVKLGGDEGIEHRAKLREGHVLAQQVRA